jgi:hypothetical protein
MYGMVALLTNFDSYYTAILYLLEHPVPVLNPGINLEI